MARKGKNTVKNAVDNLSRRNPRMNLRARLNENISFIAGNEYNEALVVPKKDGTTEFTYGTQEVYLAPGNIHGRATGPVNGVGKLFQKGIYLPGTKLTYVPAVGINTPGTVAIAYVDSVLTIKYLFTLTSSDLVNKIKDIANVKTGPVWQELEFPMTNASRRKTYSTDTSITQTSEYEIDIALQGVYFVAVYGAEANTSATADKVYGQLVVHCKERFEDVKTFANS